MTNPKKQDFNKFFELDFPSVNSFKEAKALYESIKPLRGKRSVYDIRPVGHRRHTRFQIHKISDGEYSLVATYIASNRDIKFRLKDYSTEDAFVQDVRGKRMLSFYKNGEVHIHCPIGMRLASKWASEVGLAQPTNQTWNFLSQILPEEMHIETRGRYKLRRKTYLAITQAGTTQYYLIPTSGYKLTLKKVKDLWRVKNPIQEYTLHIPKAIAALTRKAYKSFFPYAEVYWDLAPISDDFPAQSQWVSTPLGILKCIADPWQALQDMKSISPASILEAPAELAILYWRKRLRKECYQMLARQGQLQRDPVPIGQQCLSPWPPPDS